VFRNHSIVDDDTSTKVSLISIGGSPDSPISSTTPGASPPAFVTALLNLPLLESPLINDSAARVSKASQNASKLFTILSKFSNSGFSMIFSGGNFFLTGVFKKPFSIIFIARLDTFVG